MAKAKEQLWVDVHAEAIKEFNASEQAQRPERLQCLEDRRFYSIAGAQWEGAVGEQFSNKMRLEINKVHLAVIRIFNEYRNNRITVDFTPKDGVEDKLADTCNGLYRADEKDSGAEEAYDNAYEEGVGGGFGAWRLRACYEDEEDEEDERQRIRIEPIFDADSSVYFNVGAQRQDKADATKCWVLTGMARSDYKEKYNDDPASWPKSVNRGQFDWARPDIVYVAEYYKIEDKSEKLRIFKGLDGQEQKHYQSEFESNKELESTLEATGFREARQKTIKKKRVRKYIMNGATILEDCGYIAGQHIPIVPFYGKRWFVSDIERCMGHVRLAKDAQRLKNMMISKLGEITAYSSVRKPMFTPEQIAGHERMWANDNVTNYPYLLINATLDKDGQPVAMGPVAYSEVPDVPQPLAALLQITEQDMQDLLGNQQAGEQMEPNLSGKAVELIQNRLDMQVFIYMSNMAKAVKRSGEIWLSMAKEILVEEGRTMKTVSTNGEETGTVTLMKPMINPNTGATERQNDIGKAKFDVDVTVGPSSASKRSATVRALTSVLPFAANDPETSSVLIGMTMMNMEGEGVGDVRNYFRKKLLKIGAVEPSEEEAQELAQQQANQQPDPQAQYLQASAAQAVAASEKARADTVLAVAKAEQTRAQTSEILSGIDLSHQDQLLKTAQALGEAFNKEPQNNQPAEANV